MSISVMTWVWQYSVASGTDLLVLLAIADQANDDGRNAWPSQDTLAKKTRVSVRSVQRAITKLVEDGEIVVDVHGGGGKFVQDRYRPNRYRVLMPEGRQSVTPVRARDDAGDAEGRHTGPQGATPLAYDPSLSHPETSARQGATNEECGVCDDVGWLMTDGGAVRCHQCAQSLRKRA